METGGLGTLVLSLWLIASAVLLLAKVDFPNSAVILAVVAIVAGGLLLERAGGTSASLGSILLSAWLIITGVLLLAKISFDNQAMILAVFAVIAGALLFVTEAGITNTQREKPLIPIVGRPGHRIFPIYLGWLLLALWLVVQGAMVLLKFDFTSSAIVLAVLALAAGVLILLRR
jgi:hypothetical protein